jgi:hypothetical protein
MGEKRRDRDEGTYSVLLAAELALQGYDFETVRRLALRGLKGKKKSGAQGPLRARRRTLDNLAQQVNHHRVGAAAKSESESPITREWLDYRLMKAMSHGPNSARLRAINLALKVRPRFPTED